MAAFGAIIRKQSHRATIVNNENKRGGVIMRSNSLILSVIFSILGLSSACADIKIKLNFVAVGVTDRFESRSLADELVFVLHEKSYEVYHNNTVIDTKSACAGYYFGSAKTFDKVERGKFVFSSIYDSYASVITVRTDGKSNCEAKIVVYKNTKSKTLNVTAPRSGELQLTSLAFKDVTCSLSN
jgi:hypothetical protein